MIVKRPSAAGASVSGVMIPCRFTDSTSSAIRSSANSLRGLKPSPGVILSSGTLVSVAATGCLHG
jgi:hypothetical protein